MSFHFHVSARRIYSIRERTKRTKLILMLVLIGKWTSSGGCGLPIHLQMKCNDGENLQSGFYVAGRKERPEMPKWSSILFSSSNISMQGKQPPLVGILYDSWPFTQPLNPSKTSWQAWSHHILVYHHAWLVSPTARYKSSVPLSRFTEMFPFAKNRKRSTDSGA